MNKSVWWLLGICAVGLGVRLYGLDWGLPQVYEEAYPFKKAWPMWGFGSGDFDLNPHFFNYPTLYFYIQFLGQGLLFLYLKATGAVDSVLSFQTLYAVDKTKFYLWARFISVAFAVATIVVTYRIGLRVGSKLVAGMASLLVALNAYHILKSQYVEVDVPLTMFVMLTALFCLRILELPSLKNYLLAGLFAGLATSTKYSGGILPVSIILAHFIVLLREERTSKEITGGPARSTRKRKGKPRPSKEPGRTPAASQFSAYPLWRNLVLAGIVCVVSVFLTSPYILLDWKNFWMGFNYERYHMKVGHFGLDDSPALFYYASVLVKSILGWPLALLSLAGLLYLTFVRKQPWAMVLAVYPLVYVAIISSWSMKAERYILPIMPTACLIASASLVDILARLRKYHARLPRLATALALVIVLLPSWEFYQSNLKRIRGDTRTEAKEWIEAHVPDGALIVSEPYGPEPFDAISLANLSPEVRNEVSQMFPDKAVYGLLMIPMSQVDPEKMAGFYDLSHYQPFADYIVTSGSVISRYVKEPDKFAAMLQFYEELDAQWPKVAEFDPEGAKSGPRLNIYKNPRYDTAAAHRQNIPLVSQQPLLRELMPGTVGPHYQRLGAIYEIMGLYRNAADAYQTGLRFRGPHANFTLDMNTGGIRSLLQANLTREARSMLLAAIRNARSPQERAYWEQKQQEIFGDESTPEP